jgi:L-fuconolactonase
MTLERAIDSHQHFWRLSRGDYPWLTPDLGGIYRDFEPHHLRPHLSRHGIDGTILVQAAPTLEETRYLLRLAASTPFVAGVVGWVEFSDPRAAAMIDALGADSKLKGLRPMIQDISDVDWMLRPELRATFEALIASRLTFDALVFPRHLANLLELLERHPDLAVVVDHGAKPSIETDEFEPWASDIREVATSTSAYCKVSGLVTEAGTAWTPDRLRPYVEHLVECFGAERTMWGSDWPVVNRVASYDRWRECSRSLFEGLSADQQTAIYGGTAVEFYDI